MKIEMIDALAWGKMDGLLPAVIQDADTGQVLMLGYQNREALVATLETGRVTFFSRSKNRLWVKGETSGNFLSFVSIEADCDADSLVIQARPQGPTCHRGTCSCFGEAKAPGLGFLGQLQRVIDQRHHDLPEGSYTTKLFQQGIDRMAQKVGEEGVETVIAAKNAELEPLRGEAADLVFHLMVLLRARGLSLADITEKLRERHRR